MDSVDYDSYLMFTVVEERRFAGQLNQKRLAAHLASSLAVAVPVQPRAFSENPLVRVLNQVIPDFTASSLAAVSSSTDQETNQHQSRQRQFIGDKQLQQIYSLTTFVESDINKLVAVFALGEIVCCTVGSCIGTVIHETPYLEYTSW